MPKSQTPLSKKSAEFGSVIRTKNKRRAEQRQRVLEAFPAAVCEVIAEKFEANLSRRRGPALGITKLLIKLLREEPCEPCEPCEPSYEDE